MEYFLELYGVKIGILICFLGVISFIYFKPHLYKQILGYRSNLEKYWWHRFIKILFIILTLLFSIIAWFVLTDTNLISINNINTDIRESLYDYTLKFEGQGNSIDSFIEQESDYGCLDSKTGKIEDIYSYPLENESYCSPTLISYVDEIQRKFNASRQDVVNLIRKDTPRICLIHKSTECSANKIVLYDKSIIYHFELLIILMLCLSLWIFLWSLLYYRGMVYILLGKTHKLNEK